MCNDSLILYGESLSLSTFLGHSVATALFLFADSFSVNGSFALWGSFGFYGSIIPSGFIQLLWLIARLQFYSWRWFTRPLWLYYCLVVHSSILVLSTPYGSFNFYGALLDYGSVRAYDSLFVYGSILCCG